LSTQPKNTRTGIKGGGIRNIAYRDVYWFELVLYLDLVSKFQFPETTESSEYFLVFSGTVEDELTFKILKNDLITFLHRRVLR
jgi:hypothetical protein